MPPCAATLSADYARAVGGAPAEAVSAGDNRVFFRRPAFATILLNLSPKIALDSVRPRAYMLVVSLVKVVNNPSGGDAIG